MSRIGNIQHATHGGCYWTDFYGVHRWSNLTTRPGTYLVVASRPVLELARMGCTDGGYFHHPICVVDDFGSLVRVPS